MNEQDAASAEVKKLLELLGESRRLQKIAEANSERHYEKWCYMRDISQEVKQDNTQLTRRVSELYERLACRNLACGLFAGAVVVLLGMLLAQTVGP